ncbi:DUF1340 domain-containing protein [Streptococcus sp.]|uniref:DUF1340 domain-containing protein n=1 Tax=Streptococcus sp. TaxID=1306 RepID=UPI002906561B|nr:DUF1340 domain-containing protein [Streptococcus sp.]MDU3420207.1 DUF1340 domain-containing protein [Streptococcus sp.]
MSVRYKYSGLTPELYQRLVDEFNKLKSEHNRTLTKHIQEVKKCDRRQARKYFQRFDNAVKERSGLSPDTTNELRGFLSRNLINDLQAYLSEHYIGKPSTGRPAVDKINAGLTKELFQRYREEVEELRATYPNSIVAHIMEIKGCSKREAKTIYSAINALYVERVVLTPRKVVQLEGLLSRELLGDIAKNVFNRYEWPESLDSEVDRITLEYRTKGEVGRNKPSVKRYLYRAYALGV